MTTRLSMSSLAGMARTLVAVGTSRLETMLAAMALAGPRRTVFTDSSGTDLSLVVFGSCAGMGVAPVRAASLAGAGGRGAAGALGAAVGAAGTAAAGAAGAAAGAGVAAAA